MPNIRSITKYFAIDISVQITYNNSENLWKGGHMYGISIYFSPSFAYHVTQYFLSSVSVYSLWHSDDTNTVLYENLPFMAFTIINLCHNHFSFHTQHIFHLHRNTLHKAVQIPHLPRYNNHVPHIPSKLNFLF